MFKVDKETAAAIRRAWDEGDELSAMAELRRLGIKWDSAYRVLGKASVA